MAKVLKLFYLFIWIGIIDCVPVSKGKLRTDINGNTVTISVSLREYTRSQPNKISNHFPLSNFQEQYYKTMSDLFRQMEEYLNSIRIRTQDINLPFNYFSTNPIYTILSNPNTSFLSMPDSPQQNHILGIQTTNEPYHTNKNYNFRSISINPQQNHIQEILTTKRPIQITRYNEFLPISGNTPKNQIPIVTANRPSSTNLNNNFQSNRPYTTNLNNNFQSNRPYTTNLNNNFPSYSPPQNQISSILTTKIPFVTTKRTEVITTGTPIENTTPYIEEISTTQLIETTTEDDLEDDDDTTRPITLNKTNADKFNKGLLRSGNRIQPEVEHGSVQSGS